MFQSAFMSNQSPAEQSLEALQDIKRMMERSSRFISLSGLSGIAAGLCALGGAWLANDVIENSRQQGGYNDVRELRHAGLNSSENLQKMEPPIVN